MISVTQIDQSVTRNGQSVIRIGMARSKSGDPKVLTTLRVRKSVLDAYQALGADWREMMHAALEAGLRSTHVEARVFVSKPEIIKMAEVDDPASFSPRVDATPKFKTRLKGEWKPK